MGRNWAQYFRILIQDFMTREENELLISTDPGSPCGDLMRRYWQPAALSEELVQGGTPMPVRLLGEDLVLFRDDKGRPGLLGVHCSHRGADLSYGRVEDGGLRCIYHGWLYDIGGRCLDMPGERGGGRPEQRAAIRHPAYPCQERGGVVFAYLGPGEPPLLPNYEFLTVPDSHRYVAKAFQECNYLQGNEGNLDPVHNNLLHHPNQNLGHTGVKKYQVFRGGRGPVPGLQTVDAEVTDFGVRLCDMTSMGKDKKNLRIYHFVMPNLTMFPGPLQGRGGYSARWHVAIDDTHHWRYEFIFHRDGPPSEAVVRGSSTDVGPGYKPLQNKANRYLQDRSSMKTESFSGIPGFGPQDGCVIEGAGPIQDRTREHLVSSDRVIVAERKLLMNAIKDVQEGRNPPHVIWNKEQNRFPNMIIYAGVVDSSIEWKAHSEALQTAAR